MLRDRFDPRYFDRDVLFRYHAGWAHGGQFTRPSPATYVDRTGTLREAAANVPRVEWLDSATPAVLLEGGGTNGIRNPRGEGAVLGTLGSGGALPTFWDVDTPAGLTWEVVATGVEDGLPYVDVRLHGTPSQTFAQMSFEGTTTVAAAAGETWTGSVFARLVAGSLTGIGNARVRIQERSADGALLDQDLTTFNPTDAPRLGLARRAHTRILASPDTAAVVLLLGVAGMTVGNAVDVTFRIGAPQLERMPFATSLILPPIGAPAVATRAADVLTFPWGHAPQAMTGYLRFVERGAVAMTDVPRALLQIGTGTTAPRLFVGSFSTNTTYRVAFFRAPSSSVVTPLPIAPSIGSRVELLWRLYADGSVQIEQSIDGGTPVVAARSSAIGLPAAWSGQVMRLSGVPSGAIEAPAAWRDAIVLRGAGWTMDDVRRYLPW